MAPSRFQRLVRAGLDQGLSRAEAERRARDDLFGDIMNPDSSSPRDDTPAVAQAPPLPASEEARSFLPAGVNKSVDELWQELQRAWRSREEGVELVDVLEEINDLLEKGLVTQEEHDAKKAEILASM